MSKRDRSQSPAPLATGGDESRHGPQPKRAKNWSYADQVHRMLRDARESKLRSAVVLDDRAGLGNPTRHDSVDENEETTSIQPSAIPVDATSQPPEVRFDLFLHSFVEPPENAEARWKCKLNGPQCSGKGFKTMDLWAEHVKFCHGSELRLEMKLVTMVTGYVPPMQTLFGGKSERDKAAEEVDARFRGSREVYSGVNARNELLRREGIERSKRIYQERMEKERKANRERKLTVMKTKSKAEMSDSSKTRVGGTGDFWIRKRDGSPVPSMEWLAKTGDDDGGRWEKDETWKFLSSPLHYMHRVDRYTTSPPPRYPRPQTRESDDDDDDSDIEIIQRTPGGTRIGRHEGNERCPCEGCQFARDKAREAADPPPLRPRIELYGSFPFMDLPGELRNVIYEIALNDAHDDSIYPRERYKALLILQASPAIRAEALAVYASTTHFSLPYHCFGKWCHLVGDSFLSHLRNLTITFPSRAELTPSADLTTLFRLKVLVAPRCNLNIEIIHQRNVRQHAVGTSIQQAYPDSTENEKKACSERLTTLFARLKPELLYGLFDDDIISDIFVSIAGDVTSVKATERLWMTYEDLRVALGIPQAKPFRFTVNGLPWQFGNLAGTMAPMTWRKKVEIGKRDTETGMQFGSATATGAFGAHLTVRSAFGAFGNFAPPPGPNDIKQVGVRTSTTGVFGSFGAAESSSALISSALSTNSQKPPIFGSARVGSNWRGMNAKDVDAGKWKVQERKCESEDEDDADDEN